MFTIPESCKKLMAKQVTQYLADPLSPWTLTQRELALFRPFLPADPRVIVDLGCGLGRTAVSLHWHYGKPRDVTYYMLDATAESSSADGGWIPGKEEWCSDLELTREFILANGVPRDRTYFAEICGADTYDLSLTDEAVVADLIVSTLAVGFHWPIEDSLEKLMPLCHAGTVLVFGVRHGKYTANSFTDKFAKRRLVESGWKQDFLILSGVLCTGHSSFPDSSTSEKSTATGPLSPRPSEDGPDAS